MMFRPLRRLSIATQAFLFLVLILAGAASALYFWATHNAMDLELAHVRTVADMVDAYRAQASRHGGFYVRRLSRESVDSVGSFLAEYQTAEVDATGQPVESFHFHQKNPFLALSDFSKEVQRSPARAKFRMVSDNYMNPDNSPDAFEAKAIGELRRDGQPEVWGVDSAGQLRYARALKADAACLSCHGDPARAPQVVQAKYPPLAPTGAGGGYGYRKGDVVGITSVTVAHRTPWQMLSSQSLSFWLSAGALLLLLGLAYAAVIHGIVKPVKAQSHYTLALAQGNFTVRPPSLDKDEVTSGNELHRQSHALKSLHESMQTALTYLKSRR